MNRSWSLRLWLMYMSCLRTEIPIYLNLRIKTTAGEPVFGIFRLSYLQSVQAVKAVL